ncbi:MAG: hypothetical protein EOM69_07670, partial [Clostridia bacterium]|nr:hypothetical protein [Clostridia bacterium]
MDLLLAFGAFFAALVVALRMGASVLVPLLVGLVCFIAVGLRRGFALRALCGMALSGARRSLIVLRVFLLIGLVTALWRSSGVIAFFVAQGIEIDRKKIVLAEPIRALGHYEVEVKLLPDLRGMVSVTVMRQGGFEDVEAEVAAEAEVATPAEEQAQPSGQPEEETA